MCVCVKISRQYILHTPMHYFYPYILLTYVYYVHWYLFNPFIQEKKCKKRPVRDIAEFFSLFSCISVPSFFFKLYVIIFPQYYRKIKEDTAFIRTVGTSASLIYFADAEFKQSSLYIVFFKMKLQVNCFQLFVCVAHTGNECSRTVPVTG